MARRSRSGWRVLFRLGMEEMMETQQMNRQSALLREKWHVKHVERRLERRVTSECIEERRKPVRETWRS